MGLFNFLSNDFLTFKCLSDQIRSDHSLSCVRLFVTLWIAARQASLSITNSRSSLRLIITILKHLSCLFSEKAMALHSSTLAWKIPWTEEPGKLQSEGREESDTTERLPFHFSLSYIAEGNGNPVQCSCLENPRDGGAWWAAVHWVAQSRTDWSDLAAACLFNYAYNSAIRVIICGKQLHWSQLFKCKSP